MELITNIDFSILNGIQSALRCGFLDAVMGFASYIGEAGIVWIVIAAVMLFFRKTRACGVMMLAAMALGYITGDLCIKHIVARVRPCYFTDIVMNVPKPTSYSFPSGHSTAGFAASVTILLTHRRAGIAAIAGACVIAFSRLYNYVHYPSDVLCGILLGIACALIIFLIFKKTGAMDRLSGVSKKNIKKV